jgi:hypothetical protein
LVAISNIDLNVIIFAWKKIIQYSINESVKRFLNLGVIQMALYDIEIKWDNMMKSVLSKEV